MHLWVHKMVYAPLKTPNCTYSLPN